MHVSEVTSLKTELQEALADAETQRAAAQERQQDCVDAANAAARARTEQEAAECAAAEARAALQAARTQPSVPASL